MLSGGAKPNKACAEYCPVLLNLANQADVAKSTADSLQTHALEDTQNSWHTLVHLTQEYNGDQGLLATSYGKLRDDPETSAQLARLAAPFFTDMAPETREEFFSASRIVASHTVETVLAPVWQDIGRRRQLIAAACLQGPQLAEMTVDSKRFDDPEQGIKQRIVLCSSATESAIKPIDTNNAKRLGFLIERTRALSQATQAIGRSPTARSAAANLLSAFGLPPKAERGNSGQ